MKLLFLSLCIQHQLIFHNPNRYILSQVVSDPEYVVYNRANDKPWSIENISIKSLSFTGLDIVLTHGGCKVRVLYLKVV